LQENAPEAALDKFQHRYWQKGKKRLQNEATRQTTLQKLDLIVKNRRLR